MNYCCAFLQFCCPNPGRNPQNSHRNILLALFYLMLVGVVVKLWIFTAAIHSTILTSICSVLTFVLLMILINHMYYIHRTQQDEQRDYERYLSQQRDRTFTTTEEFPYVLGRTVSGNFVLRRVNESVSEEGLEQVLDSLRCFHFDGVTKLVLLEDKHCQGSNGTMAVYDIESEGAMGSAGNDLQCTVVVKPSVHSSAIAEQTDAPTDDASRSNAPPHTDDADRTNASLQDLEIGPKADTAVMCTICLADYEHSDSLVALACRHIYHRACLKEWLRRKNACPLCKEQVASYHNHVHHNDA